MLQSDLGRTGVLERLVQKLAIYPPHSLMGGTSTEESTLSNAACKDGRMCRNSVRRCGSLVSGLWSPVDSTGVPTPDPSGAEGRSARFARIPEAGASGHGSQNVRERTRGQAPRLRPGGHGLRFTRCGPRSGTP